MGGGRTVEVLSRADWDSHQRSAASYKKIVVVDFFGTWCGPCKVISPVFEELSTSYPNAVFLNVDVDQNSDLAMECGVRAMPTFHVYSGGKKVDEVVGANIPGLKAMVAKHYTQPTFAGQGRTLGSKASESAPQAAPSLAAPKWSGLDESKPATSIQIRLADGSRLVGKFNTTHTIADIRAFIRDSKPSLPAGFQLVSSFPPKPLTDDSLTIEAAGLQNAAVTVR